MVRQKPAKLRSPVRIWVPPMLYLIATPIGNLQDISLRALDVLKRVDYILAEDTRHSLKLLTHYEIQKPLISYHQHNEAAKLDQVIQDLKAGKEIALISDAGTPLISDPGFVLVRECRAHNLAVTAIPGASSLLVAITLSGFEPTPFQFVGFLPKKPDEALEDLLSYPGTSICYESPERIIDTLKKLASLDPECRVCIARELTKHFEEVLSGSPEELIARHKEKPFLGEIVLLIEGKKKEETDVLFSKETLNMLVSDVAASCSTKEAISKVAKQLNISKRTVYNAVHT